MNPSAVKSSTWGQDDFDRLEGANQEGLAVPQILEVFAQHGERLTEATFRKYVQLGLLPRSIRVGRKGKHRGSQGMYPATVVRQVNHIRRLMAQGFTIDEIQREFLFMRGEIEALTRQLERVYAAVEDAANERDPSVLGELSQARVAGEQLVARLEEIERRLSMRARMARAAI